MIEGKYNKDVLLDTPLCGFDKDNFKISLFYACTDSNTQRDNLLGSTEKTSYLAIICLNDSDNYQKNLINKTTTYDEYDNGYYVSKYEEFPGKKERVFFGIYNKFSSESIVTLKIKGEDKEQILNILKKDNEVIKQTNTCHINRLEDIISISKDLEKDDLYMKYKPRFVYRGHASTSFDLIPTVGRSPTYSTDNEQELFDDFKRKSYSYFSSHNITNDLEKLAMAQHYKLQTRLLDFTTNPLASLWFACNEFNGMNGRVKDGIIYILHTVDIDPYDMNQDLDFDNIDKTHIYIPPILDDRLKTQQGLFIIPKYANINLDLEITDDRLKKYIVNGYKKIDILKQLYKMGVTAESLYHGLDGIGTTASWVYQNKEKEMTQVKNLGYIKTDDIVRSLKYDQIQDDIQNNIFQMDIEENNLITINYKNNNIELIITKDVYYIYNKFINLKDTRIELNKALD